jgi:dermatan 4-sulfotransferase 1
MSRIHHFIHIKHLNLLYGRVPKVANTSIKAVLCRLLPEEPNREIKTTSDRFWRDYTHQQTELLSPGQARKLRSTHFSFSFVRNPFDRFVAAYNNKVIEIEDPPLPMQRMGICHGMTFENFVDVLCKAPPESFDVHLMPQSEILCAGEHLVPKFVGRMEQMNDHWKILRRRLQRDGIKIAKELPEKNVRRGGDRSSLRPYFNSTQLIDRFLTIYGRDLELFYSKHSIDQLIDNETLQSQRPMRGLKADDDASVDQS